MKTKSKKSDLNVYNIIAGVKVKWSKSDDSYVARNKPVGFCVGVGDSKQEALKIYFEHASIMYMYYLQGTYINAKPPEEPLDCSIKISKNTHADIEQLAKALELEPHRLVEYLVAFFQFNTTDWRKPDNRSSRT